MAGNFDSVQYNPNAFLEGAKNAMAFDKLRAQNAAAASFDPLDTQVSQAILNKSGQYADANALQDRPLDVQKAQLGVQQQQQNLDNGAADQAMQNDKAEWEKVGQVTDMLSRVADSGQDPVAAYKALGPVLQSQLGLSQGHYDALGQQLAADPKGFLTAMHQRALEAIGNRLVDKNTGQVVLDAPATAAKAPKLVMDGQGRPFFQVEDPNAPGGYSLTPATINADGTISQGPAAPASAARAPLTEDTFAAKLQQIAPGAVVTSGLRDAAHNKAVGGALHSNHLTGQAADVAPGPNQTMAQLNAALQSAGFHTLPEFNNKPTAVGNANHIHVDFNQGAASAPSAPAAGGSVNGFALKQPKAAAGSVPLDPAYAETVARQVQQGGKDFLPTGNGPAAQAARQAVQEAGVRLYGDKWDPVGATAEFQANKKSLGAATQQSDIQQGFETAAKAAADLITISQRDLGLTGLGPMIDGPLLEAKLASGDPKVAKFSNFVKTFADEYAKIIGGGTGSAAATEGARNEAHSRINAGMSKGQLAQVIAGMKQEMAIKIASNKGNVQGIRDRIRAQPSTTAATGGKPSLDSFFKDLK